MPALQMALKLKGRIRRERGQACSHSTLITAEWRDKSGRGGRRKARVGVEQQLKCEKVPTFGWGGVQSRLRALVACYIKHSTTLSCTEISVMQTTPFPLHSFCHCFTCRLMFYFILNCILPVTVRCQAQQNSTLDLFQFFFVQLSSSYSLIFGILFYLNSCFYWRFGI